MRSLTPKEILDAWEAGQALSPNQRAVYLLKAAYTDMASENINELSIGQRDRLLLNLRAMMFGKRLDALEDCPACGEKLELAFDSDEILCQESQDSQDREALTIEMDGYQLSLRHLTVNDLNAISSIEEIDKAEYLLLERSVVEANFQDGPVSIKDLPQTIITAIDAKLAETDPQADTNLSLDCPACNHQWLAKFDILSFLWREIEAWAQKTLYEVHRLALAYGWRESDVLALSPWRRQYYLAMVGA